MTAAHPAAGARDGRAELRWSVAAQEHQAALASFLDAAGGLDDALWSRPRAEGKWSAAQTAEHLALAYEAMLRELDGGGAMQLRAGPWQQKLLRWFLLPHILYHRNIPLRARAPRETRPPEPVPPLGREAELERLEALGQRFEAQLHAAWRAGGGWLTHPYFGSVPPLRMLRFAAIHVEHHRRQLPRE